MQFNVFDVGHPAYSGVNAMRRHSRYVDALRDLLKRGVTMEAAHAAMKAAMRGEFSTAWTRDESGVVEVIARVVH